MIVVMKANWRALEFASKEMKGDCELCTAVAAQDW